MNLKRPRHRGGSLCSPKHPTSPTSILKRQPGESWDFWIIYTSCEGCLKHVQGKKNRKPKVLSAFRFNDSHSATLAFAKGKSGTSSSKKTSKRMMGFLSLGWQCPDWDWVSSLPHVHVDICVCVCNVMYCAYACDCYLGVWLCVMCMIACWSIACVRLTFPRIHWLVS